MLVLLAKRNSIAYKDRLSHHINIYAVINWTLTVRPSKGKDMGSLNDNSVYNGDKKVQWAENLEEVRYFVPPNNLRKSFKKRMSTIRRKASEISDKPLRIITSMGELSANAVQNGLEFILRHGQSGSFDAENVTYEDLIKEWDKLFELSAATNGEESTDDDEDEKLKWRSMAVDQLVCAFVGKYHFWLDAWRGSGWNSHQRCELAVKEAGNWLQYAIRVLKALTNIFSTNESLKDDLNEKFSHQSRLEEA